MEKHASLNDIPLPPYAVRRSRRARRIGLRVQPGRGLEVVLPWHADAGCVPDILARHRDWIQKALSRTAIRQDNRADREDPRLPSAFTIKGGEETIWLHPRGLGRRPAGRPCAGCRIFREHAPVRTDMDSGPEMPPHSGPQPTTRRREITLAGMCAGREMPEACMNAALERLRAWVRSEARLYLGDMLEELAERVAISYSGLTVRFQRTRWGSCSATGRINLNASLLFLPKPLTRYILVHELCHLRRMDHSERFWKEVFAVEPDALVYDKAMRGAWRYVPAWVMPAPRNTG